MKPEQIYFNYFVDTVYEKLTTEITSETIPNTVFTINKFQQYYFEICCPPKEKFLNEPFFRRFKQEYSLQGIDSTYLEYLENKKARIYKLIEEDEIMMLYFEFFHKAKITQSDGEKEKDLGSFFSKFLHTFRPHQYCALDNPIKNYFGLQKESFVFAFLVVSTAYQRWAKKNEELTELLRAKLESGKHPYLEGEIISDLKLLDMLFWSKANPTLEIKNRK